MHNCSSGPRNRSSFNLELLLYSCRIAHVNIFEDCGDGISQQKVAVFGPAWQLGLESAS